MKKCRLLAAFLAILMVISMLPMTVSAASDDISSRTGIPDKNSDITMNELSNDESIYLAKGFKADAEPAIDGSVSGTLRLESYAKGKKVTTTTEKHIPADIVLVLDVSGSVEDDLR